MTEIKIIEIPISEADFVDNHCFNERGEKYFMGLMNKSRRRVSILFKDLSWLRKHYGVEHNPSSPITFDSLNDGRRNELADYKACLDAGVPMRHLYYIDLETNTIKINPETEKRYRVDKLDDDGKKMFRAKIKEGLYCLYKYV